MRLVAQQVKEPVGCAYKLVAYSREYNFSHVEFGSLADLRAALLSAMPDFDFSHWNEPATQDTQILFATGLNVSQEQIRSLGFTISAR